MKPGETGQDWYKNDLYVICEQAPSLSDSVTSTKLLYFMIPIHNIQTFYGIH